MGHGGHSIVARGLYHLQLLPYLENYPHDQLKIMSIQDIKGDKGKVQQTMFSVFEFLDLPPHDIEDISPKNTREYISHMSPEIRVALENFYAPFNKKLFTLIGKDLDSW